MKDCLTPENETIVERIEGNILYLKGHKYPFKGIPTIERIDLVNRIKRWPIGSYDIEPPMLEFSKEFFKIASFFSDKIAGNLAFVFDYDQAYRFRVQDLLSSTTKERLLKWPIWEILRLQKLNAKRDYFPITLKFQLAAYLFITLIIFRRESFLKAIQESEFKNFQFDENDIYWARQKLDYDYLGEYGSLQNRRKALKKNKKHNRG